MSELDTNAILAELHNVYIADGFNEDCQSIVKEAVKADVLRFEVFCNIWQDMKFSYIFHGRSNISEIAEFSEEVLLIAKQFMVGKECSFKESVAGLFLLYGLSRLQPFNNFAHVRLLPSDVEMVKRLERTARMEKHYDVLYILGLLLIEGPVEFHFSPREYGMERPIRRYFENKISIQEFNLRKGVLYNHKEELEILRQLSSLSRRYSHAKALIHGKDKPDRSLNYAHELLANELAASLTHVVRRGAWCPTNVDEGEEREKDVKKIKSKAMQGAVAQLQHRVGISKVKKKRTEIETIPSPIKSSPERVSPRKSPRKKTPKTRGIIPNYSKKSPEQATENVTRDQEVAPGPAQEVNRSLGLLIDNEDNVQLNPPLETDAEEGQKDKKASPSDGASISDVNTPTAGPTKVKVLIPKGKNKLKLKKHSARAITNRRLRQLGTLAMSNSKDPDL